MRKLDGSPPVLTEYEATPYILYRKNRIRFLAGSEHLNSFRLSPDASSARTIATCCNTPVNLDFEHGHWLSLYGVLWTEGTLPPPEMHTMTSDLPDGAVLPNDIPNAKKKLGFFLKLFGAWIAMGFRHAKSPGTGEIHEYR